MSEENAPQSTTEQPNNSKRYITVALILLLLGTWGYILWDKNKTSALIQQKDGQISTTLSEKDSLQALFTSETSRYDSLKTVDLDKDNQMAAKDKDLADKADEIKAMLAKGNLNSHELAELKRKIKAYNNEIEGYKKQIEELKAQNSTLKEEKEVVTSQRDSISKMYDSTKKSNDNIIDIGSTLHASNFSVEGIDEKKSGKEKETTRAKKVNKLHVSFDLDENRIVQSGIKELYITIASPDGKVLSGEAQGSGTFTPRDSSSITYTQKIEITYVQGQRQTISTNWKGASFEVGSYKVEVYENGFKIGTGTVALRKGGLF